MELLNAIRLLFFIVIRSASCMLRALSTLLMLLFVWWIVEHQQQMTKKPFSLVFSPTLPPRDCREIKICTIDKNKHSSAYALRDSMWSSMHNFLSCNFHSLDSGCFFCRMHPVTSCKGIFIGHVTLGDYHREDHPRNSGTTKSCSPLAWHSH